MANTNLDIILQSMGRSQDPNFDDILSGMGGAQPGGPIVPGPVFTVQPTISPSTGTANSTTYTATPGTVTGGSITSRAWLLNGTSISSGLTASPVAEGTLTYQEIASGAGGSTSSVIRSATVSAATPTPTPTPTPSAPLRAMAVESRGSYTTDTVANTTQVDGRWSLEVGQDAADMVLALNNWYTGAQGAQTHLDQNTGNGFTVLSMAIENSGATATIPVTKGGQRSWTIADGANNQQTDNILPPGGLSKFTKGDRYWIKYTIQVPTSGVLPVGVRDARVTTGCQVRWYDPAVTTTSGTDALGLFTYTGTAPISRNFGYIPLILGHVINDEMSIMAGPVDSIATAVDDKNTPVSTNAKFGIAFFQRAMHDAGTATTGLRASLHLGAAGARADDYTGTNTKWRAFLPYVKAMVSQVGTNDISTGTGTALATALTNWQNNLLNAWAAARAAGVTKIVHTMPTPRCSGTFVAVDGSDQTPLANWSAGGAVDTMRTWLQARKDDGTIDVLVSMNSVRNPSSIYKWIANGSSGYSTTDGLHPLSEVHELMATELRAALASL